MPLDELLDGRIREALQAVPVPTVDLADVETGIRRRARTRQRRWRAGSIAVVVGLGAISGVVATRGDRDETVIVDQPEAPSSTTTATTATTAPDYGFGSLTPLIDGPLPTVPLTVLVEVAGGRVEVSSEPGVLGIQFSDDTGAGSTYGDPLRMPAMVEGGAGRSPSGPEANAVLFGMVRSEVASIEVRIDRETAPASIVRLAALPQLAFYYLELDGPELPERQVVVAAYDASGNLLTDSERLLLDVLAFAEAMNERDGIAEQVAAIVDVALVDVGNGPLLRIRAHGCGGDMTVRPTIDETTLVLDAATLTTHDGPCLDGETGEILLDLGEPVGDRVILDGRTGEVVALVDP